MSLKRALRDERGTMIEIPLLLAFVLLAAALMSAYHSVWKGLLAAALYIGGGLAALVGVGLLWSKLSGLAALGPVRHALESGPARRLAAAAQYATGGIVCGVVAAFVAMFVAPGMYSAASDQLKAINAITASGAVAGFVLVYGSRRQDPKV